MLDPDSHIKMANDVSGNIRLVSDGTGSPNVQSGGDAILDPYLYSPFIPSEIPCYNPRDKFILLSISEIIIIF